eukprot:235399-Chlamydomonas_euryale.AAC.1
MVYVCVTSLVAQPLPAKGTRQCYPAHTPTLRTTSRQGRGGNAFVATKLRRGCWQGKQGQGQGKEKGDEEEKRTTRQEGRPGRRNREPERRKGLGRKSMTGNKKGQARGWNARAWLCVILQLRTAQPPPAE